MCQNVCENVNRLIKIFRFYVLASYQVKQKDKANSKGLFLNQEYWGISRNFSPMLHYFLLPFMYCRASKLLWNRWKFRTSSSQHPKGEVWRCKRERRFTIQLPCSVQNKWGRVSHCFMHISCQHIPPNPHTPSHPNIFHSMQYSSNFLGLILCLG